MINLINKFPIISSIDEDDDVDPFSFNDEDEDLDDPMWDDEDDDYDEDQKYKVMRSAISL